MLVREGNKISVVRRSRKVEKVIKDKTFLQDIAEEIDSYLSANKIKGCVIEMDYAIIDCRLDVRSFGTKIKDVLKGGAFISEEDGFLDVCGVNPILDGNGACNKCIVVMYKKRGSYKEVSTEDVPKFVLGLYKEVMEELNSKKEK